MRYKVDVAGYINCIKDLFNDVGIEAADLCAHSHYTILDGRRMLNAEVKTEIIKVFGTWRSNGIAPLHQAASSSKSWPFSEVGRGGRFNTWLLGPYESTTQTVYRSVQPFLQCSGS